MASDGYRRGYVSFAHFLLYFNEYLLEINWGKHTFFGIENHLNVPKSRIDILFDTRGSGSV